jgi:hypothetical protein
MRAAAVLETPHADLTTTEGKVPMRLKHTYTNTSRLFHTAGTFGKIQIVATQENVVVDVQTRNYATDGQLHRDHALANMSLAAAVRLRDLLIEAVDHAASVTLDTRATAQWSPSAATAVADRFGGAL